MKETQENLIQFLEKAYDLTTQALKSAQAGDFDALVNILDNRERAINIVQSLSENLALHQKNSEEQELVKQFNSQVNLIIEKIHSMDEIIQTCLEHERDKTQFEIAKTFKNKENFKGYNLNKIR